MNFKVKAVNYLQAHANAVTLFNLLWNASVCPN